MPIAVFHFMLRLIVVHVLVYAVVHFISYELWLATFYNSSEGKLSLFLRNPEDSTVWAHVWRWILPAQILRGLLLGIALSPFYIFLKQMKRSKRFLVLFFVFLLLGAWGSYIAGPGNLEGLLHLHPDISIWTHLAFQPIIIMECLLCSLGISLWMGKKEMHPNILKEE